MNFFRSLLLIALTSLFACQPAAHHDAHEQAGSETRAEGPHGGRLLEDGNDRVEIALQEANGEARFHAWASTGGKPVAAQEVQLSVQLKRLGRGSERVSFTAQGDGFIGQSIIAEPHSFEVDVQASIAGRKHQWRYDSYEGRTTIAASAAQAAGIETAIAGPGRIAQTLTLYGAIGPDTTRLREVRARFPGVIRGVRRQVGERVRAGETLATVESNDSLQTYAITAPMAGVVTQRHAEPGEHADDQTLFQVADFSRVWAEFSVFPQARGQLRLGQPATVTAEGGLSAQDRIRYVSPLGTRDTQTVGARVELDNAQGLWTPGQFVEAQVTLSETPVAVAVPLAAIQTLGPFTVVFMQVGDVFEAQPLTLGRRDDQFVEVLSGLAPGTVYVTRNSYLIKADIEKSGASHDH